MESLLYWNHPSDITKHVNYMEVIIMASKDVKLWRERTKKKLVDCLGGKCNRCAYDKCCAALDFHHIGEKSFVISSALAQPKSWEALAAEAKKCILLCRNCHSEFHAGLWKLDDIPSIKFTDISGTPKDHVYDKCPMCNKNVTIGRICCSRNCAGLRARKINWPSDEELLERLVSTSKLQLASELGVSECAVRKRLKRINV